MSYNYLTIPFGPDFNFDPLGTFRISFYLKIPLGSIDIGSVFNRNTGMTVHWGLKFDASTLSLIFTTPSGDQLYNGVLVLDVWQEIIITYLNGRWTITLNSMVLSPNSYKDSTSVFNGQTFSINNPIGANFLIDEISVIGPAIPIISDPKFLITTINDIYSSVDSTNWTLRQTDLNVSFTKICKSTDADIWVVGTYGYGGNSLYRSTNKIDWTGINISYNGFIKIVYGNTKFVAIDSNDDLYWSADGVAWNYCDYFRNQVFIDNLDLVVIEITDCAFGNGVFTFVDIYNRISFTTTDCINFVRGDSIGSEASSDIAFAEIYFGNGLFIISKVLWASNNLISSSSDGLNWVTTFYQTTIEDGLNQKTVSNICYGYDLALAINMFIGVYSIYDGGSNTTVDHIITSIDAITWSIVSTVFFINDITFYSDAGNSKFIAVGLDGLGHNFFKTIDGITWTTQTLPLTPENIWA